MGTCDLTSVNKELGLVADWSLNFLNSVMKM